MRPIWFVIPMVLASASSALEENCADTNVVAEANDTAITAQICEAATGAFQGLAACDLPVPTGPLHIKAVDEPPKGCIGVFHCGTNRIEVASPETMARLRSETGVFSALDTPRLFQSVIHHEIAHALFDQVPCPLDSCIATSEYFAYTFQLMGLRDEERRAMFDGVDLAEKVGRDAINKIILFMKPDRFVTLAWSHSGQRADRCEYLRWIADGRIRFDHELP